MTDMKPCPNPWCPDEKGLSIDVGVSDGSWHIVCDDCAIYGPWRATEADAIEAWNARDEPAQQQRIAVLEAAGNAMENAFSWVAPLIVDENVRARASAALTAWRAAIAQETPDD